MQCLHIFDKQHLRLSGSFHQNVSSLSYMYSLGNDGSFVDKSILCVPGPLHISRYGLEAALELREDGYAVFKVFLVLCNSIGILLQVLLSQWSTLISSWNTGAARHATVQQTAVMTLRLRLCMHIASSPLGGPLAA